MSYYNPADWYWYVGSNATQVYSSRRGIYVYINDVDYLTWKRNGNNPTRIDSETSLNAVLLSVFPQGMTHPHVLTPTLFFAKFDPTSLTNIQTAGAVTPATADSLFISYFLNQTNSQTTVDITSTQIGNALDALVLLSLLTSGEKTTIVTP